MKFRHLIGFSIIAIAAMLSVPIFLMAPVDSPEQQAEVRVMLLESGAIQIAGSFLLEVPGTEFRSLGGAPAGTLRNVSVKFREFIMEADEARAFNRNGEVPSIELRDAVIALTQ